MGKTIYSREPAVQAKGTYWKFIYSQQRDVAFRE